MAESGRFCAEVFCAGALCAPLRWSKGSNRCTRNVTVMSAGESVPWTADVWSNVMRTSVMRTSMAGEPVCKGKRWCMETMNAAGLAALRRKPRRTIRVSVVSVCAGLRLEVDDRHGFPREFAMGIHERMLEEAAVIALREIVAVQRSTRFVTGERGGCHCGGDEG